MKAEDEALTLKSWDSVYKSYQRFGHCDDGAIGEGYSDSIARLLNEDWEHLDNLYELSSRDKKFKNFVLSHIDELMSPSQAEIIKTNARTRCSLNAVPLCRLIELKILESERKAKRRN